MAKYKDSLCRLCRREGTKLFLKGSRCISDKCAISRRNYAPGQHGQNKHKLSNYGQQMREKQKVKRIYGLLERQFRVYFQRATKIKGVTGEILLQLLERRIDNVAFRLCLAKTRQEARQIVKHGHVYVNNRRVDIPSYTVKTSDIITLKGNDKYMKYMKDNLEIAKDRGVPTWLKFDQQNLKAEVSTMPKRADVAFPIQEQLIVELYSK